MCELQFQKRYHNEWAAIQNEILQCASFNSNSGYMCELQMRYLNVWAAIPRDTTRFELPFQKGYHNG